jgi:hypothetical protein
MWFCTSVVAILICSVCMHPSLFVWMHCLMHEHSSLEPWTCVLPFLVVLKVSDYWNYRWINAEEMSWVCICMFSFLPSSLLGSSIPARIMALRPFYHAHAALSSLDIWFQHTQQWKCLCCPVKIYIAHRKEIKRRTIHLYRFSLLHRKRKEEIHIRQKALESYAWAGNMMANWISNKHGD